MPATHDDRTPALGLPLPHQDNQLEDDVLRIRTAFAAVDTKIAATDAGVDALRRQVQAEALKRMLDLDF